MAWIELHQTMPRHRKTLALASMLDISRREAIGLLIDLWTWAVDNADKDGLLYNLNEADIAAAIDFPKKRSADLLDALVDSGYVERTEKGIILHDWYDYCGKLNDRREDTKRRVAEHRNNRKKQVTDALRNADVTRYVTRTVTPDVTPCNASTVPNRTVPNNIYTEADNNARASLLSDAEMDAAAQAYLDGMAAIEDQALSMGMPYHETDRQTSERLMAEYTADWVLEAMRRAAMQAKDKRSWSYIEGILKKWRTKGGIDDVNARPHIGGEQQGRGGAAPDTGDGERKLNITVL